MTSNRTYDHTTKKYHTIGEAAKILGVSTSLIRFWEKQFPSLQPQKDTHGRRRYTHTNIAQLKNIYQLVKEKGYTLKGAKEAIKLRYGHHKPQSSLTIRQTLQQFRDFLVLLKSDIQSLTQSS